MKGSRFKLNQNHAPIHEALETFRRMRVVPFDVPGHKRGRGNPELTEFLGQKCVGVDVNSMKPLDNLCHPVSVIREAEELAADAFGAAHAFLMVGGTTSSGGRPAAWDFPGNAERTGSKSDKRTSKGSCSVSK